MPFIKLDTGILESTLWIDRALRDVFITSLLMAEPIQLKSLTPTYEIGSVCQCPEFLVPPDWYGFVPAADSGIIRRALVEHAEGMEALKKLASPDPSSRSPEHEGRRMVRISGGFIILNYMKYREKDHGAAERMRLLRARRKQSVTANCSQMLQSVTYADAYAYADAETSKPLSAKAEKSRAQRLPKDFRVTDEHRRWASEHSMPSPDLHVEEFRDYWFGIGGQRGTKLDWDGAFRNWIRKASERRNGNGYQRESAFDRAIRKMHEKDAR